MSRVFIQGLQALVRLKAECPRCGKHSDVDADITYHDGANPDDPIEVTCPCGKMFEVEIVFNTIAHTRLVGSA